MLRLPQFGMEFPEDVASAVVLHQRPGARVVAGGTDILPNLKHGLEDPELLVSLARVQEMNGIALEGDRLRIGARATLSELAEDSSVREHFPSLAKAASLVASPLIRNMGTIGGNVNLDTRCRYVNQTEFWREALGGGCLKSEGDVCWVVPKGRNCVAAMSSDSAPVLISLDAEVVLVGPEGERVLPISEYYSADGLRHTQRADGELMTEIRVPLFEGTRRCDYTKWSVRKSIDFPLVSVALRFDLDGESSSSTVEKVRVVAGALGAKPRIVSGLDGVIGKRFDDPNLPHMVSAATHKQCKPLENLPYEAPYRRQMIKVLSRRAVEALVAET
jgi:4-hydroxybenzoyl-CoA reductase subunit beta